MFIILDNILKLLADWIVPFLPVVELILFILNNKKKEESIQQQIFIESQINNNTEINIFELQNQLEREQNRQEQIQKNMRTINKYFNYFISAFIFIFFIVLVITNYNSDKISLIGFEEIGKTSQFLINLFYYPIFQLAKPLILLIIAFSISNLVKNIILNKNSKFKMTIGSIYYVAILWLSSIILFSSTLSIKFDDFSVITNTEKFSEIFSSTSPLIVMLLFFATFISYIVLAEQFFIQKKFNSDYDHNIKLFGIFSIPIISLFITAWLLSPTSWPFDILTQYLHNLLSTIGKK